MPHRTPTPGRRPDRTADSARDEAPQVLAGTLKALDTLHDRIERTRRDLLDRQHRRPAR